MATFVGASAVPTRYRVRAAGMEVFVRCGADILLAGVQADLQAEARCPACDKLIGFEIRGRRVENLEPLGALLHVVELSQGSGLVGIECEATHIFDREECLRRWTSSYVGRPGLVLDLQAYLDRCSKGLGRGRRP